MELYFFRHWWHFSLHVNMLAHVTCQMPCVCFSLDTCRWPSGLCYSIGVILTILMASSEGSTATEGDLPASPYWTRKQVASYLRVSEKWLAQSGRSQGPKFYKFGAHCRYLIEDVRRWAQQQKVPA